MGRKWRGENRWRENGGEILGWGKMAGGILARENVRGDFNRQPPPDNCSLTTAPRQLPLDNCPQKIAPGQLPPNNCPPTTAPGQLPLDNCPRTIAPSKCLYLFGGQLSGGKCLGAVFWEQLYLGGSWRGAVGRGQSLGGKFLGGSWNYTESTGL